MTDPFFTIGGPISLHELRRLYITRVIDLVGGNLSEAAKVLEVDRRTIYRWRDEQATPVSQELA